MGGMKSDCPAWWNWIVLIAGILYVAGDLGFGPGLLGIDVWHFLVLMFGIGAVAH